VAWPVKKTKKKIDKPTIDISGSIALPKEKKK